MVWYGSNNFQGKDKAVLKTRPKTRNCGVLTLNTILVNTETATHIHTQLNVA